MSVYKLTYFDFRGRGETARLIFAAAGVEYEDIRIEHYALGGPEWKALKPTTPFGQLPILEVDGVKLSQSYTICRFLARRFNLAGKTDLEQARADMLAGCFEDALWPAAIAAFYETDPVKQADLYKKYAEEQAPVYLDNLEKLLKENNGGDGFFVGDDLTWADLTLTLLFNVIRHVKAGDLIEKRPKLFALNQRVEALPRIAEWIAKRPKSDY